MQQNLLKKFTEFGFGSVLTLILGLISTPIITRLVSPDILGVSSLFNTFANLISVLIIVGLDQAFVRFFYEEREENRAALLYKTIRIPIILNVVISLIVLIFYKPISQFLVETETITVALFLIIQNTFIVLSRFGLLIVRLQQKGKIYSYLQILGQLGYFLGVLLMFYLIGDQFETIIMGTIISNLLIAIASIVYERKFWKASLKKFDHRQLVVTDTDLLKFGAPLILTLMINWIFISIDKLFIKSYCGNVELGIYTSAFSIISLLNVIQTTFNTFWVPVSYENYKSNPDHKQFFRQIMSIISVVMIMMAMGIILCKDLLIFFLGEKYRVASFVLPFLVFIPLINTVSETTVVGINFMKKPKYHLYVAIISSIVNIIGNIILVPQLGAVGAAMSTGCSYIVYFIARTIFSEKVYPIQFELRKFYISTTILFLLALYASFNSFSGVYFMISSISILLVLIIYSKNIIEMIKGLVKKQ